MIAFLEGLKNKYKTGNLPIKLIFINIGVFIVSIILNSIFKNDLSVEYLGLNSTLSAFIIKPWTLFTYMFLHIRAFHLLFNMIMLWVIGDFFYKSFGDKAFAQFYFLGGIFGGVLYLLLSSLFPNGSYLMGASASIYAVLFAMVAYQPNLKVRLFLIPQPIKLLHVAIGFIVFGFLLSADNLGGNISHVGGALFGYIYMKQFEKGKTMFNFISGIKSKFKTKKKSKLHATKNKKPPRNDYDYNELKKQKEERTNRILEKISRSGYNSLTDDEKAFLFNQRGQTN